MLCLESKAFAPASRNRQHSTNIYNDAFLRKGPSIKHVHTQLGEGGWGYPKCLQMRTGGRGIKPEVYLPTYTISFLWFWQHVCLTVPCIICRNLTLPSFKMCSTETVILLQRDQCVWPWNKGFFTLFLFINLFFANQSWPKRFQFFFNRMLSLFYILVWYLTLKKSCAA